MSTNIYSGKKSSQHFRTTLFCLLFFLFAVHYSLTTSFALEVPVLKAHVNDYGNMMPPETRANIEAELKAFEQSDSTQVVILTVPSLEGETLEEFSIKVAEAWKIGQREKDNGIILLVSNQDRKISIEVGRGLEGRLTDLMAGRIIEYVIKPRFKRGDFNGGFIAATQAMIDVVRGEFKADENQTLKRRKKSTPLPVVLLFSAIMLVSLGRISRILGGAAGAIGFPLAGLFMVFLLRPSSGWAFLALLWAYFSPFCWVVLVEVLEETSAVLVEVSGAEVDLGTAPVVSEAVVSGAEVEVSEAVVLREAGDEASIKS